MTELADTGSWSGRGIVNDGWERQGFTSVFGRLTVLFAGGTLLIGDGRSAFL